MIPRQRFADHHASLQWKQGQHVLIVSPTGGGKTTLAQPLLQRRSHVVSCISKVKDRTISKDFRDWTVYREFPDDAFPRHEARVLLWPKPKSRDFTIPELVAEQRLQFTRLFNNELRNGKRCIYIDEGLFICDPKYVGLASEVGMLFYTGRSNHTSMVVAAQRPKWFPKVILSSCDHVYFGQTADMDDMKTLSDMGVRNSVVLKRGIQNLESKFDYVYIDVRSGNPQPVVINTRY